MVRADSDNGITMKCPICNSRGIFLYNLKADYIINRLEDYFGENITVNLHVIVYTMCRCPNCTLEYADPSISSNNFYEWITQHNKYYPENRWEWVDVVNKINDGSLGNRKRLLEVGCGAGDFLKKIKNVSQIEAVGLDTTNSSVEKCVRKGIVAHCKTLDSYIIEANSRNEYYDIIVAFHCLEHIAEPKHFVASMLPLLKQGGRIFLSTPYSPMSFENAWYDPLNHPPHHFTRWNETAYKELANQLHLNVEFSMPKAPNAVRRSYSSLNLMWNGPAKLLPTSKLILKSFFNPKCFAKEIMRQWKREKVNGRSAADVVLVEMTRKI